MQFQVSYRTREGAKQLTNAYARAFATYSKTHAGATIDKLIHEAPDRPGAR